MQEVMCLGQRNGRVGDGGTKDFYFETEAELVSYPEVVLDLLIHHFDGQGCKNSIIIYYYPTF